MEKVMLKLGPKKNALSLCVLGEGRAKDWETTAFQVEGNRISEGTEGESQQVFQRNSKSLSS